jgi:dienelactone hydrolase
MIFGATSSFEQHARQFEEKIGTTIEVRYPQTPLFFLPGVINPKILDKFVAKMDHDAILRQIDRKVKMLENFDHNQVFLVGYGLGGVFSLKYAENHTNSSLAGVVAFYPHLSFSDIVSWPAPNLEAIHPTLLLFGEKDDKVGQKTLDIARGYNKQKQDDKSSLVQVVFYPAGHAFADRKVQYFFRSPKWDKQSDQRSMDLVLAWIREHSQ